MKLTCSSQDKVLALKSLKKDAKLERAPSLPPILNPVLFDQGDWVEKIDQSEARISLGTKFNDLNLFKNGGCIVKLHPQRETQNDLMFILR